MKIKTAFRNPWIVVSVALTVITVTVFALAFTGYKAYKELSKNQTEQLALIKEQIESTSRKELESSEARKTQTEALKSAQSDLSKTKQDASRTESQLNSLKQSVSDQAALPKDQVISSGDISNFLTGVVQVICLTEEGNITSGSGSFWDFSETSYSVLTNYHVVPSAVKCVASITDTSNQTTGIFSLDRSALSFNKNTDTAILYVDKSISEKNLTIDKYNFSLSKLRKCPSNIPVGSPVVIIGFPAYAKRSNILEIPTIGAVNVIYRTVTNGILSGYDTSLVTPNGTLKHPNFFISAKIDSGNSGGIALGKDSSGMCVLGVPTWLTLGNYETQGLVQNILNVIP